MLGYMYEHGYGAPQFYDAAADLYMQAAAQGNPFAQGMLGLMYDKGQGVQQTSFCLYVAQSGRRTLVTARTLRLQAVSRCDCLEDDG